jgi:hypothetical protein
MYNEILHAGCTRPIRNNISANSSIGTYKINCIVWKKKYYVGHSNRKELLICKLHHKGKCSSPWDIHKNKTKNNLETIFDNIETEINILNPLNKGFLFTLQDKYVDHIEFLSI